MTVPPDATSSNGSPATLGKRPGRSIEGAAVAGVVYAVLAITGLALPSRAPDLSMGSDELTEWFGDTGHQAELITGLNAEAFPLWVLMVSVVILLTRPTARAAQPEARAEG